LAAAEAYNPLSVARNKEFGGLVYESGGKYFSTAAVQGERNKLNLGDATKFVPKGATVVGAWHTHGAYDRRLDDLRAGIGRRIDYNQVPSGRDIDSTLLSKALLETYGLSGRIGVHILGTPSGQIFEFSPRFGDRPGTVQMVPIGWSGGGYGFTKP
jgi:hypothetical protein